MPLLAECVEAGTDDAEIFGTVECAKATGYLLFHFLRTNGSFIKIVRERHCQIADKKQHGIDMLPQAAQQVAGYGLLGAGLQPMQS
jgi:hypothetical protein